jgi:hypothetical protein
MTFSDQSKTDLSHRLAVRHGAFLTR